METKSYFGHMGVENGGRHIVVCRSCCVVVFITEKQLIAQSTGNVLDCLNQNVDCCKTPNYHFHPVVPFANIKHQCPTCGQKINTEEER